MLATLPNGIVYAPGMPVDPTSNKLQGGTAAGRRTPKLGGTPTWLQGEGDEIGCHDRQRHDAGAVGPPGKKPAAMDGAARVGKDAPDQGGAGGGDSLHQETAGAPTACKKRLRRSRKGKAAPEEDVKTPAKPEKRAFLAGTSGADDGRASRHRSRSRPQAQLFPRISWQSCMW